MKKAREIVIPKDRALTNDEFEDFKLHALNSSLWYATEYTRSEKQITEKLLKKGYVLGEVEYLDKLGKTNYFDIVEFVINALKDALVLNDETYARGLIRRYGDGKRGKGYIKQKLREKGIDSELADELLEELRDEEQIVEAIGALANRYRNSSAYTRVPEEFKRNQKLMGHLISRGYSFDDIALWKATENED